jgi:hypothetical protein
MLSNPVISWIRTVIPLAVGTALTWLAAKVGVVIDEDSKANVAALVVLVVSAVYYSVVHALEQKWPVFGWLLGDAKLPYYHGDPPA